MELLFYSSSQDSCVVLIESRSYQISLAHAGQPSPERNRAEELLGGEGSKQDALCPTRLDEDRSPLTVRIRSIAFHSIGILHRYFSPPSPHLSRLPCIVILWLRASITQGCFILSAHSFSGRSGSRCQNLSHLTDRFAESRCGMAQATYVIGRGRLRELSILGQPHSLRFRSGAFCHVRFPWCIVMGIAAGHYQLVSNGVGAARWPV